MDLHVHIISRAKAKELGMKRYFTGKPCKRGGIGERYVSSGECRCGECRRVDREAKRNRHWGNREVIAERMRKHGQENREVIAERKRKYNQENREEVGERKRRYYEKNKSLCFAYSAHRRAAKIQRTLMDDCELTHLVEREAYTLAAERKEQTGFDWHIDHMIPLQGDDVSGFHHWSNLQVIPAFLNLSKHNRMIYTEPFEWLKDA